MGIPTPCEGCATGKIEDAWARFDHPYCKPCSTKCITSAISWERFQYCYATWRDTYPHKATKLDMDIVIYRRHAEDKVTL